MIRRTVIWLVVFTAVAMVFIARANAQTCTTEAAIRSVAERQGSTFQPLDKLTTAAAVTFYDSVPPGGVSGADTAALIHHHDGSGIVVVGTGGMFCGFVRVGPGHWKQVIKAIMGENS